MTNHINTARLEINALLAEIGGLSGSPNLHSRPSVLTAFWVTLSQKQGRKKAYRRYFTSNFLTVSVVVSPNELQPH